VVLEELMRSDKKRFKKHVFDDFSDANANKKPGPGYNASFETKTPARQCASAVKTRDKECAGPLL
jgi:hypothetical protein